MKLLHIDSSVQGQNSVSRQLSADIVAKYKAQDPAISVTYRDLAVDPLTHLSGAYLAASNGGAQGSADGALLQDLEVSKATLAEFLAADVVVVGVPVYNFNIPSQLKAWVDRIVVNNKTFRYLNGVPQGLAGGKTVILAVTRGGFFGPGSPIASWEHAESYLRVIFGFIGVTDLQVVIAEGLHVGPEQHAQALTAAARQIAAIDA